MEQVHFKIDRAVLNEIVSLYCLVQGILLPTSKLDISDIYLNEDDAEISAFLKKVDYYDS